MEYTCSGLLDVLVCDLTSQSTAMGGDGRQLT